MIKIECTACKLLEDLGEGLNAIYPPPTNWICIKDKLHLCPKCAKSIKEIVVEREAQPATATEACRAPQTSP